MSRCCSKAAAEKNPAPHGGRIRAFLERSAQRVNGFPVTTAAKAADTSQADQACREERHGHRFRRDRNGRITSAWAIIQAGPAAWINADALERAGNDHGPAKRGRTAPD